MNFLTPCAMYHGTSVHQSNRCNKWCTGSEFCEYTLVCSRSNLWFSLTHWRRREVDGSQFLLTVNKQWTDHCRQMVGRVGMVLNSHTLPSVCFHFTFSLRLYLLSLCLPSFHQLSCSLVKWSSCCCERGLV